MITDEEVLAYLEHHGVKGMRWGSRKARSSKTSTVPRSALRVERAPVHHPPTKKQVVGTLAVGLGAAFVANRLKLNIPASAALGLSAGAITNAIIDRNKDKKLSEL
jgi:hypothetical protein